MSDIQADQKENTQAPASGEAESTQTPAAPDTSWVPKRISEITAARRAAEARAAELEAELQRVRAAQAAPADGQPAPTPNNQSVEQLARAYAEKMVREQTEAQTINSRIAAINEAGAKEFGDDFEKSVQNLQVAGVGGPDFLRVITNIPKAEAVVTWLGKPENMNEAMRIASMDPVQMGIELTKMSSKAAKELGKQISKAPPPIEPVGGGGGGDTAEPDPKNVKEWMAWRAKNKKTRR